mmetsp:Transcript_23904/g.38421  ORF Transcript_23904/g.38421 Transcript_23904/m.38421 type:complete len:146 (+) Transcript_23904:76-513(+)
MMHYYNTNSKQVVKQRFQQADKDKDGKLSVEEFRLHLSQCLSATEEQAGFLMHQFDTNQDHYIDEKEFTVFVEYEVLARKDVSCCQAAIIAFLTLFAYCCCICTLGLACIPFYFYMEDIEVKNRKKILNKLTQLSKQVEQKREKV